MLRVEKEVPGHPNTSCFPCPSPCSFPPLLAPDSPIGRGNPPLSFPTYSLSFPLPLIIGPLIKAKGPGELCKLPAEGELGQGAQAEIKFSAF